jgi:hypothetical protein
VLSVDYVNGYVYTTKEASIATGANIQGNDCPSIVILDDTGLAVYPLYGRDYTAATAATGGGNTYLTITFVNNFEASFGTIAVLSPGLNQVLFRVKPANTDLEHGKVLQLLLESAGLTVNTTGITYGDSSFQAKCAFSIPFFDEQDFSPYLKYVQAILSSTLGYIYLNDSFQVTYRLFDAPAGTTTVDNVDIVEGSFRVETEYRDLIDQLITYNPHYNSSEVQSGTNKSSLTASSLSAKYLHGINNATRFRHVLTYINGRVDTILGVRSNRLVKYIFDTVLLNIDSNIGDDITLSRSNILGNDATKELTILSLDKSPRKTTIIATDLLGV